MPIYEYRCGKCDEVHEVQHKIADPAPESCPECGGGPMTKLISATAFVLKGSGWYNDGYGGKSSAKKPSPASDSPGSTSSNTESASSAPACDMPATDKKCGACD